MLTLNIPSVELYDEEKNTFALSVPKTIQLEHSLLSISKWEAKWHKPFMSEEDKTDEMVYDYIRCMTITPNVDPSTYKALTPEHMQQIKEYIENPMTATWFNDRDKKKFSREIVTSELIYYWMTALQIPFECEKWHLNRLLTLIHVANNKNAPAEKMSRKDIMRQNHALNAARKAKKH